MLTNLAGQSAQLFQLAGSHEQLFVVSPRSFLCTMLVGDVAAHLAVVFGRHPDTDMDGGEHSSLSDHWMTSACPTPKRTNSGVQVMARSRAAASRMASPQISVGIRFRYFRPFATD
jgi:hypothetical protein